MHHTTRTGSVSEIRPEAQAEDDARSSNFEAGLKKFAATLKAEVVPEGTVVPLEPGQQITEQPVREKPSKLKIREMRRGGMSLSTWDPVTKRAYAIKLSGGSRRVLRDVDSRPDGGSFANSLVEADAEAEAEEEEEGGPNMSAAPLSLVEELAGTALAPKCCCGVGFARVKVAKPYESKKFKKIGMVKLGCTATMIGERVAVTAGHCVWDLKNKKPYALADMDLYLGRDGPGGIKTTHKAQETWVASLYKQGKDDYDVGFIVLKTKPSVGYFGFKADKAGKVELAGYPLQTKTAGVHQHMWRDECTLVDPAKTVVSTHKCDTEGGNSGSAVAGTGTDSEYIYAIHSGVLKDTSNNVATQIYSPGNFEMMKTMKYKFK